MFARTKTNLYVPKTFAVLTNVCARTKKCLFDNWPMTLRQSLDGGAMAIGRPRVPSEDKEYDTIISQNSLRPS